MRKRIVWLFLAIAACGPGSARSRSEVAELSTSANLDIGLFFGDVAVGQKATLSLGIANGGGADLVLSTATAAGTGMSYVAPALPLTLHSGASASLTLQFAPATAGAVAGDLVLVSNAANSPATVPLSGTGTGGSYSLWVSGSSSRAPARGLAGAALSGPAYVFTSDASGGANPSGIAQVAYFLDDPSMVGAPLHVEKYTPYDFAGGAADGSAAAWDTSRVSSGKHSITQQVTLLSGSVEAETASFTISTGSGVSPDAGSKPPPDAGSPSSASDAGSAPAACSSSAVPLSAYGSAGSGGDDTAVFQNALNGTAAKGQQLRIPRGTYSIRSTHVPSGANVCFDSGVTVNASAGYGPYEVMWDISGVSNVVLMGSGATFHMNPNEWSSGPDPEYRHCVAIIGSSNVHVGNFSCITFGGDGIYLGGNSVNALVEDVTADGSARDGLTVISAKNSTIQRCHFNNGHTAVDMEPNVASDALDGVLLQDSTSDNNNWGGVNVSTYAYNSSSTPLNVVVRNHVDSNTGVKQTAFDGATSFSANGTNGVALGGRLLYDHCTSINAGSRAAWVAWWTANGPNVTFQNLTIKNPNQAGTAVDRAAVAVGRGGGGVGDQGNAYFYGTSVSSTDGKIDYYFTFYDGSGQPFSNVKWLNAGSLSGAVKAPPDGLFNGAGVSTVNQ